MAYTIVVLCVFAICLSHPQYVGLFVTGSVCFTHAGIFFLLVPPMDFWPTILV